MLNRCQSSACNYLRGCDCGAYERCLAWCQMPQNWCKRSYTYPGYMTHIDPNYPDYNEGNVLRVTCRASEARNAFSPIFGRKDCLLGSEPLEIFVAECDHSRPFNPQIQGTFMDIGVGLGPNVSGGVFLMTDGNDTGLYTYIQGGFGYGFDAPTEILFLLENIEDLLRGGAGSGINVYSEASLQDFAGLSFNMQVNAIGELGLSYPLFTNEENCNRTGIIGFDAAVGFSITGAITVRIR